MTTKAKYRGSILRWIRVLFLALGATMLGFVGYSFLDVTVFQAYQNWRLDRALTNLRSGPGTTGTTPALISSAAAAVRAPATPGTALGRIQISRIDVSVIIVEGTDEVSLRRAVGHISGTALPGEQGNVGLAGHRDTFFRSLRKIRQKDDITLTTVNGVYHYQVDSMKVAAPTDGDVLIDSGGSVLTLVTCYPFYFVGSAPNRFIVRAHLI
jgi:sortase A